MHDTRHHELETPGPVTLALRTGGGLVRVSADATDGRTRVDLTGRDADQVVVEQRGDGVVAVVAPRPRSGFGLGGSDLLVTVSVPPLSHLEVRVGSADLQVTGRLGSSSLRSGSGTVDVESADDALLVESGSGDVRVRHAADGLRVKSGSGDVRVDHCAGTVAVSSGSGDVTLLTTRGPAAVKTGSGQLRVVEAHDDVALSTASGDLAVETLHRGRLTAKGASGDVEVGVPAGTPVWTDVSTLTGRVDSRLEPVGAPAEGQDHVEVRATSVSGSVTLRQR